MASGVENLNAFFIADVDLVVGIGWAAVAVDGDEAADSDSPSTKLAFAGPLDTCLAFVSRIDRAEVLIGFRSTSCDLRFIDVAAEHQHEVAFGIELLHAAVGEIDHVDSPSGVHSDSLLAAELTNSTAFNPRFTGIAFAGNTNLELIFGGRIVIARTACNHIPAPGPKEVTPSGELDDAAVDLI
ncbi:MAG TPA: hypothetical protein VK471_02415 [Solirubrobacterales bacterium]|nr:hypothetical protein [Solirubrobacterales bacterium]